MTFSLGQLLASCAAAFFAGGLFAIAWAVCYTAAEVRGERRNTVDQSRARLLKGMGR